MLQVIQNYNTGELKVEEVPEPGMRPGGILVHNMFSLISAGTERNTVETAQKTLVGKAQSRPDLVRQVIQIAKRDGIMNTIALVKNKLDTPVPLGYSSAGIVMAVAEDVDEFAVGDHVACAGQGYASHADVVFIPRNLAVKMPAGVSFEAAAYTTLGAIAMQGIRQARVTVGEKSAVIGLGLLGLLTVQILKASGCKVAGIDIDNEACEKARSLGADLAFTPESEFMPLVEHLTQGHGFDHVIITAASTSNQPVILAGHIVRHKGKVIIEGAVPAEVPRSPYYEKEIDVLFARSYGPGRYDYSYEEQGRDYPYGYVRWTENRNMAAFLELIEQKRIDVRSITTHTFKIEDAAKAYALITGHSKEKEKYTGILIQYSHRHIAPEPTPEITGRSVPAFPPADKVRIGFLGAGNFAQNYLLPLLKKNTSVELAGVSTSKGITAQSVAKKFKFRYATTLNQELIQHPDIVALFIATRHHLHAPLVAECLKNNKSVFTEKPLAMNFEQLRELIEIYNTHPGRVMIGFNRRFAPAVRDTKLFLAKKIQPCMVTYRINAGYIPISHWIQDPEQGGGRIVGEVCHFVDLISYLIQSIPVRVFAEIISSTREDIVSKDNLAVTLKYRDGSVATVHYIACGDKSFPKERVEIFCENSVAVIDDFRRASFTRNGKTKKTGGGRQEKGYRQCLSAFIHAVAKGQPSPISFDEAVHATVTTFKILESLSKGLPVDIRLDDRQEVLNGLSRIYTESQTGR